MAASVTAAVVGVLQGSSAFTLSAAGDPLTLPVGLWGCSLFALSSVGLGTRSWGDEGKSEFVSPSIAASEQQGGLGAGDSLSLVLPRTVSFCSCCTLSGMLLFVFFEKKKITYCCFNDLSLIVFVNGFQL